MNTYCFSDIHGQYNLWKQIKDYLKEDDVCYVLGDCIDRGQNGYQILKEVLEDKRCIFLLGNHEDMMLNYFTTLSSYDKRLWFLNGGEPTYNACKNDLDLHDILQKLELAPKEMMYKNIHLSHAGIAPGVEERDLLWDRDHIYTRWFDEEGIDYVVHGHTPEMYIQEELFNLKMFTGNDYDYQSYHDVMCKYCEGHKICIDGGSVLSHKIGLLNLDTLELAEVFTDASSN